MRRGMRSLALQVQQSFGRDPYAGDLYIFRGRRGDLCKIIWHDGVGMSLYAKALLSNCVHALRYLVLFLTIALSVMRSFRMVATIASLKGLPAPRSRLVVAAKSPLPERAMVSAAR